MSEPEQKANGMDSNMMLSDCVEIIDLCGIVETQPRASLAGRHSPAVNARALFSLEPSKIDMSADGLGGDASNPLELLDAVKV